MTKNEFYLSEITLTLPELQEKLEKIKKCNNNNWITLFGSISKEEAIKYLEEVIKLIREASK